MIGNSLFSTYTLAFWIASIILMIAMIGSLIIARADSDDHETHTERLIPNGEESAKE
jgi:general stress protein CsbA